MIKLKRNTEYKLNEQIQFLLKEIKHKNTVHNVKNGIITVSLFIIISVLMSFLCSYNSVRVISSDLQPGYVSYYSYYNKMEYNSPVNEQAHFKKDTLKILNTVGFTNPFATDTTYIVTDTVSNHLSVANVKSLYIKKENKKETVKVQKTTKVKQSQSPKVFQNGIASHMGNGLHGKTQADGTKHNKNALICAHRTLPFGTILKVTNTENGKSVNVTVTDRGPYISGRVVDLSLAAANRIDIKDNGLAKVKIEIMKKVEKSSNSRVE